MQGQEKNSATYMYVPCVPDNVMRTSHTPENTHKRTY